MYQSPYNPPLYARLRLFCISRSRGFLVGRYRQVGFFLAPLEIKSNPPGFFGERVETTYVQQRDYWVFISFFLLLLDLIYSYRKRTSNKKTVKDKYPIELSAFWGSQTVDTSEARNHLGPQKEKHKLGPKDTQTQQIRILETRHRLQPCKSNC